MIPLDNSTVSSHINDLLENEEYPLLDRIAGFLDNGVNILIKKTREISNRYLDCRDYAFEHLGLAQYKYLGGIDNIELTSRLRNNELPELISTDIIDVGVLVAYFFTTTCGGNYIHYGVCVAFEKGKPLVESLWSEHDLIARHKLGSVASHHGDHVEFYKLRGR
jgi:hypothetical protein